MEHRPLIVSDGQIKQLPTGDTIVGSGGTAPAWSEPLVAINNGDPQFIFTADGDPVVNEVV